MDNQPTNTPVEPVVQPTAPQPPSDPKSLMDRTIEPSKPAKSPLVPMLLVLFLVASALAVYFYFFPRTTPTALTDSSPTPASSATASADPTADWQTYTDQGMGYSVKYPMEANLNLYEKKYFRVSYMGHKQIESGRTETSLFDGYSVTIVPTTDGNSLDEIYTKRVESFDNACDPTQMGQSSKITISGYQAIKYSASCLGDYTTYIINHNNSFVDITLMTTGDGEDLPKYLAVTNQILSTFKFTDDTSPTNSDESELISTITKVALANNTNPDLSVNDITIKVQKLTSTHAMGTLQWQLPDGQPGSVWFAAKHDGVWTQVWGGQEPPDCNLMEEWNFPSSVFECNQN